MVVIMNYLQWFMLLIVCNSGTISSQVLRVNSSAHDMSEEEVHRLLHDLLDNYDTRIRPNFTGSPLTISLDLSILSFGNIEEVDMVFPVDMFLRQRWHDPRLKHRLKRPLTLLMGKRHPADTVWVPDTAFINSVSSKRHHVTVNNDKLDIHPDGMVFWGTRVTSVGSCRLDLRSYPMDTQVCHLGLESYAYPVSHVVYKWHSKPGIKLLDKEMSQYEMVDFKTEEIFEHHITGNYSILDAAFTFKRRMGNSILRIYIPTIAIVCVSWISLWIDQESTAARVCLCITTLLTLSTIWGAVNSTLPRVSYIKAVDVFFMVSFFFVFYTLIQYTLVVNLCPKPRLKKVEEKQPEEDEEMQQMTDEEPLVMNNDRSSVMASPRVATQHRHQHQHIQSEDMQFLHCPGSKSHQNLRQRFKFEQEKDGNKRFVCKKDAHETSMIDLVGRVALPTGYLMFNIYYWTKYLGLSK